MYAFRDEVIYRIDSSIVASTLARICSQRWHLWDPFDLAAPLAAGGRS